MKTNTIFFVSLATLFLAAAGPVSAAFSTYFNMDGLSGDGNQVVGHSGDTVIDTFGWCLSTNASGQPAFILTLQKTVSVNSPALAADCANGVVSSTATIACYRPGISGTSTNNFYSLTLTNVQVASVSVTNDPTGESLAETVKLQCSAIQWSYTPQNPDGSYGTPIVTSYVSP